MERDTNPAGELTIDQLAEATATEPDTLRHWQALGLLTGTADRFERMDVERARLIMFAERRGITAEAIATAAKLQGDMLGDRLAMLVGQGIPRTGRLWTTPPRRPAWPPRSSSDCGRHRASATSTRPTTTTSKPSPVSG